MNFEDLKDHIIMCGWNEHSSEVIRELLIASRSPEIVVLADIEIDQLPEHKKVHFVKGNPSAELLKTSGVMTADTVIVLRTGATDAHAVLTTLMVESVNPHVYTVVEIKDKLENEQHCKNAHADEIVSSSALSSRLIARCSLDHQLSSVIGELLTSTTGNEIYIVHCPQSQIRCSFTDAMSDLYTSGKGLLIGYVDDHGGVHLNPDASYKIRNSDKLVFIANEIPQFS